MLQGSGLRGRGRPGARVDILHDENYTMNTFECIRLRARLILLPWPRGEPVGHHRQSRRAVRTQDLPSLEHTYSVPACLPPISYTQCSPVAAGPTTFVILPLGLAFGGRQGESCGAAVHVLDAVGEAQVYPVQGTLDEISSSV
jgi:hypothetical protein